MAEDWIHAVKFSEWRGINPCTDVLWVNEYWDLSLKCCERRVTDSLQRRVTTDLTLSTRNEVLSLVGFDGLVTYFFTFSFSVFVSLLLRGQTFIWTSSKQLVPKLRSLVHLHLQRLDWLTLSRSSFVFLWVCLYLDVSRQWVIVLPSVGMTKPGHSTLSHSPHNIFETASCQYVCAGNRICEW